jgi:hypothetical protein
MHQRLTHTLTVRLVLDRGDVIRVSLSLCFVLSTPFSLILPLNSLVLLLFGLRLYHAGYVLVDVVLVAEIVVD